jgi:hypothetical protein
MSRQVIAVDAEYTEISFSDPDHGWLLIYSKGEFLPEEKTGSVQRTVDGGLTWTMVSAFSLELGALLVAGSLTPNCNAVRIVISDALNGWITEDCDQLAACCTGHKLPGKPGSRRRCPTQPGCQRDTSSRPSPTSIHRSS